MHVIDVKENIVSPKKNKTYNFQFKNKAFSKDYCLVNEFPDTKLVKENQGYKSVIEPRITTRDLFRTMPRKPFVSPKDPPNENRFDPPVELLKQFQTLNNSVLSTCRRT